MTPFAWALLAAACWGCAPIFEKFGLRGATDPMIGVVVRSIGVVIGLGALLALTPKLHARFSELTPRAWLCLAMGGILASILGQAFFYRALKEGPVSQAVPVAASYPVLACLLGVAILGEPMTAMRAAGILLVVIGTYLLR